MTNQKCNDLEHYDIFEFNEQNSKEIEKILSFYPKERKASAVMPLLHIAQRQNLGFITHAIIKCIAEILEMKPMHVYEVAKFYSMYNLSPVGRNLIQICRTTPCWLSGSQDILNTCRKVLEIELNETTSDNLFTLKEVECLGACVNGPVVQINDDYYYENLTPEKIEKIILEIKKNM